MWTEIYNLLFLNRKKYNFAENVVLYGAISAQTNTISLAMMLMMALRGVLMGVRGRVAMAMAVAVAGREREEEAIG